MTWGRIFVGVLVGVILGVGSTYFSLYREIVENEAAIGTIDGKLTKIEKKVKGDKGDPGLPGRDADEQGLASVGSVVFYMGPLERNPQPVEKKHIELEDAVKKSYLVHVKGRPNWVVCNGVTLRDGQYDSSLDLHDADNDKDGYQVPNLLDRFVKCVDTKRVGKTGGMASHGAVLGHKHEVEILQENDRDKVLDVPGGVWKMGYKDAIERGKRYTGIPIWDKAAKDKPSDLSNEPPFLGLMAIVRVK